MTAQWVGSLAPGARLSVGGKTLVVGTVTTRQKPRSYMETRDVVIAGVLDGLYTVEIRVRGGLEEPRLEVSE